MRTPLDKTIASLAWVRGTYLTVIMLEALYLHSHSGFKMWYSNSRTLRFILTQAKGNKGKMHISNPEAVGLWTFPLIIFISELYLSLMRNDWKSQVQLFEN